jgi:hypothetical protein
VPFSDASKQEELQYKEFNESMPDSQLLLQGNVWRDAYGLQLEGSTTINLTHRQATTQPHMRSWSGIQALGLLKASLWPCSYSDLEELWELHPDAIIEFGAYDCAVGVLPHRNTIIWECRLY